jgi:hypothetical protein
MLRQPKTSKVATTLVVLLTIVATGLAPVADASSLCALGNGVESCAVEVSCCCGDMAEARACCCRREKDSPPPASVPSNAGSALKWMTWVETQASTLAIATPDHADLLPGRSIFAFHPRSVQSLLCVWRI